MYLQTENSTHAYASTLVTHEKPGIDEFEAARYPVSWPASYTLPSEEPTAIAKPQQHQEKQRRPRENAVVVRRRTSERDAEHRGRGRGIGRASGRDTETSVWVARYRCVDRCNLWIVGRRKIGNSRITSGAFHLVKEPVNGGRMRSSTTTSRSRVRAS